MANRINYAKLESITRRTEQDQNHGTRNKDQRLGTSLEINKRVTVNKVNIKNPELRAVVFRAADHVARSGTRCEGKSLTLARKT